MKMRNTFFLLPLLVLAQAHSAVDTGNCFGNALTNGICDRNPLMIKGLLGKIGKKDCAQVTKEDLCTVSDLDLPIVDSDYYMKGMIQMPTLTKNDFAGLYKMRRFVVMFSGLDTIEADAFEGLLKPQKDDCYPYSPNEKTTGLRAKAMIAGSSKLTEGTYKYPTDVDTSSCLVMLDFSHNLLNLGNFTVGMFKPLKNVVHLEIDSNPQLRTKEKDKFSKVVLWTAVPGVFDDMPILEELDIDGSGLGNIQEGTFANNKRLNSLDLKDDLISDIPDDLLGLLRTNKGNVEVTLPMSTVTQMQNEFGSSTVSVEYKH